MSWDCVIKCVDVSNPAETFVEDEIRLWMRIQIRAGVRYTPVIVVLVRLRQEDRIVEASLDYIVESLSQNKKSPSQSGGLTRAVAQVSSACSFFFFFL